MIPRDIYLSTYTTTLHALIVKTVRAVYFNVEEIDSNTVDEISFRQQPATRKLKSS
jgi:hypothetical protein